MTIHKFHKIENNTVTDSKLVDIKNCSIGSPLIYNEADGIAYMNNLVAGTWVGDVEDVPAYTGHAAINGTFENNYFKLPSPHASFVWNDSTKTWDNPVPNPDPSDNTIHWDNDAGIWTKVVIDSEAGTIHNENWDGSSWTKDDSSVTAYDPDNQPPNPYA